MNNNQPIGLFDSGVGGLTVANAIAKAMPNERLIYFGDTAHLPYGDKSADLIKGYAENITKFLLQNNCKAVVIACNTASSVAFEVVQDICADNAIAFNVIDPVVKKIVDQEYHKVGIIGTLGTIGSNVYYDKIKTAKPSIRAYSLATPLLAPMIESGFVHGQISELVIENYLVNDILEEIEAIVLGCTHYPLIKKQIEQLYLRLNKSVEVLATNEIAADFVKKVLEEKGLAATQKSTEPHHFFVSDYTASFEQTTRLFYGAEVKLERVSL
ncbi:MAG: glutamate racemase [Chitinophagales bacterium]